MKAIQKILVPTDLSEFSIAAMDYAVSLGAMHRARIYMLYVIEGEPIPKLPVASTPRKGVDELKEGKKELHKFVYWKLKEIGDVVEIVRQGKPSIEISEFAEAEGIDLIVMATHGRTGLSHVLMGSVAEKVVRMSPVPVLTVKPREFQSPMITQQDIEEDLHLRG